MYPIAGKAACGPEKEAMLRAGLSVLINHRKRLVSLQEAGWGVLKSNVALQSFRNCPPSVFVTEDAGHPHPCHHPEVCPWCYARWVKDIFTTLARVITPKDRVVWTVGRHLAPWNKNHANVLKRSREYILKLVTANLKCCRGLHWSITAEPYFYRGDKKLRVSYRLIALLEPGKRFDLVPRKWYGQTLTKLHKKRLVGVVNRLLRYPEYLFRGEPNDIVAILDSRRGLRLSECYGSLRTAVPLAEKGDTNEKVDHSAVADCP